MSDDAEERFDDDDHEPMVTHGEAQVLFDGFGKDPSV